MKSITRAKPMEAVLKGLEGYARVFIAGCGTCATMCRTGGVNEVAAMSKALEEAGKLVTGSLVIPTACDTLTHECMEQNREAMEDAQAALIMSCAFGVQTVAGYVIAAFDEIPAVGDRVDTEVGQFEVLSMDAYAIDSLRVSLTVNEG